ncbi:hypothetical protein ACF08M_15985 [Streptomyces sp. NPDC015032]|uniref:hypothetical protein n=1 Tax=Streptomyces sp. NPDC015032 TaxID=3364937 RepID=UPI0036FFF8D3
MDGVVWLALSTGGLLVMLNLGVGVLALWSHRDGLRATERLIASGELDVYHAAWLTGPGYERSVAWGREYAAAETALRSLTAAGLVRLSEDDSRLVPAAEADEKSALPPEHPLTVEAWQFTFGSWSTGHAVTVRALATHPAFRAACAAHAERLSDYLPPHRTRHDDRARRAPPAAGLIAAGWVTLNAFLVLVRSVFGEAGTGTEWSPENVVGVIAATLATAALAVIVLVSSHVFVWQGWQDRWPRRLRAHCRNVIRRESHGWIPPSHLPRGDDDR